MNRYDGEVLKRWSDNVEREVYLNTTPHDLNDSSLFGVDSEELQPESWIDLKRYEDADGDYNDGDNNDNDDDSQTIRLNDSENEEESNYTLKSNRSSSKRDIDLNTSLTTILSKQNQHSSDPQQFNLFMDVSNSSSISSNQSQSDVLSFRSKKRKKTNSGGVDYTNTIVIISIVASLSFSAGYALGQSKRH